MLEKIERLISEINKIHLKYARDYFETGKVKKIELNRTLSEVSINDILKYRLNFHESINDYLIFADLENIDFQYRVKSSESIQEKIDYFLKHQKSYPTEVILNDILGVRIVLSDSDIIQLFERLTLWREQFGLINWNLKQAKDYTVLCFYFKEKLAFSYPWELQILDEDAKQTIVRRHQKKR